MTYSMGVFLDGHIVGPDGGFDFTTPDREVFRSAIDDVRSLGGRTSSSSAAGCSARAS